MVAMGSCSLKRDLDSKCVLTVLCRRWQLLSICNKIRNEANYIKKNKALTLLEAQLSPWTPYLLGQTVGYFFLITSTLFVNI